MNRTVKIIFTLSVILNIALLAGGAGWMWKMCGHDKPFRDASPQTRAAFKEELDELRPEMRKDVAAVRAAKDAMEKIITAETFDRDAFDAEVAKVLDLRGRMAARFAKVTGTVLEDLPQAEREKIAQKILAGLTRGPHHRKGGRDRDGEASPERQIPRPPPAQ